MAKPKHRDQAAAAQPSAPHTAETVYDPGGHVALLHDRLEQQLYAMRMTAPVSRPAPVEPVEQFIRSVSRISGPLALIAASAALVWAILAALS